MTHVVRIHATLHREEHSHSHITLWATMIVHKTLCAEVMELSLEKHGLHFRATSMTAELLESAFMHKLAEKMQEVAPNLWCLFFALLDSTIQQAASYG